jgi:predicted AAA+ superfamily ATPase
VEIAFEEWNLYARRRELREREVDFSRIESNARDKIVAITGIRRSGKSSLLMLLLQRLLRRGERAAYINLEDSRIKSSKTALDDVIKWFGDSGYLLLDEITNAHDWENWLLRAHELLKGRLFLIVTSSRRRLIVPSKPLRGRIIPEEIYPLSFREFLRFKGIEVERTTAGIGRLERALEEYLIYGGFPEVVLSEDRVDKIRILNSYFRDIIVLDVAEVAEESVTLTEIFGKYVIETPYFSASKCHNFLKSLGFRIGKDSILKLERISQESYLFFFVPIFSRSIKNRLQYPRKAYLGDTGFMYAISGRVDMGRIFENTVFLELRRRMRPNQSIGYWRNREGLEVDFLLLEGIRAEGMIQVSYDIDRSEKREIKGLISCSKETGLKEGIIITRDKEGIRRVDGVEIRLIPLWKWLIEG